MDSIQNKLSNIFIENYSTLSTHLTILCDTWYGFPTQKRPRKERIHGICSQLQNVLSCTATSTKTNIHVIGKPSDISILEKKIIFFYSPTVSLDYSTKTIETFISTTHYYYLSPDANESLSLYQPPPQNILIGMIIDRKVVTNRSKRQAETLNISNVTCVRLPLETCEVDNKKALNIDTVCDLMMKWMEYSNMVDTMRNKTNPGDSQDNEYKEKQKKCFVNAWKYAWEKHKRRHPQAQL